MKRFQKYAVLILLTGILIGMLAGCKTYVPATNGFTQQSAIEKVIKDHPDFPRTANETLIRKIPTGGPPGSTADVKFTTQVEYSGSGTYTITLIKDWGFSVNGEYVKSFWKYKVSSRGIKLLDSQDKDKLINTMK